MSVSTLLELLDKLVLQKTGEALNYIQKAILKGSLEGKTYSDIAQKSHLSEGYIGDKGSELWKLLSDVCGIDIHKSTARGILENIFLYNNESWSRTIESHATTEEKQLKLQADIATESLYNADYHQWLEITIEQLRYEQFSKLDLENLIEELLAIGKIDLRIANSLIKQIIIYRLKLDKLPDLEPRKYWQKEINNFQEQLEDLLSSSLKAKINLETIYSRAKREILIDYAIELPQKCPYSLDDLGV